MPLKYGLEVTQVYWKWHHSTDRTYVLAFHSNSVYGPIFPILYRFQDKAINCR